jgi:pyruvyl transferase EpsI
LLGVPAHGNIGDHAIAYAESVYLRDRSPSANIIELTEDEVNFTRASTLKKVIRPDDIIFLHGGGNIGTLWNADRMRYRILRLFPGNQIILFPQSVFFEDSPRGHKAERTAAKRYGNHAELFMTARELTSYEYMKKHCRQTALTPDIVLFLDKQEPRVPREGILLVLRDDPERHLSDEDAGAAEAALRAVSEDIRLTDTVLPHPVYPSERETAVGQKLDEFRRAKLVVTDRLHGMVFAAITATPCIALPNSYHKVKGLYEWMRGLDYIRFSSEISEVAVHAAELWDMENTEYDTAYFRRQFSPLDDLMRLL